MGAAVGTAAKAPTIQVEFKGLPANGPIQVYVAKLPTALLASSRRNLFNLRLVQLTTTGTLFIGAFLSVCLSASSSDRLHKLPLVRTGALLLTGARKCRLG